MKRAVHKKFVIFFENNFFKVSSELVDWAPQRQVYKHVTKDRYVHPCFSHKKWQVYKQDRFFLTRYSFTKTYMYFIDKKIKLRYPPLLFISKVAIVRTQIQRLMSKVSYLSRLSSKKP